MSAQIRPLRVPSRPEWWVITTPVGRRVVPYRPRSIAGSVGPFASEATAAEKRKELETEDIRRRTVNRVLAVMLAMAAGIALALVLQELGR